MRATAEAYKKLETAYSKYLGAVKSQDIYEEGYWGDKANEAKQELDFMKEMVSSGG